MLCLRKHQGAILGKFLLKGCHLLLTDQRSGKLNDILSLIGCIQIIYSIAELHVLPTLFLAEGALDNIETRIFVTGESSAKVLLEMGYSVSGSDISPSSRLHCLPSLGASVCVGHDPTNVAGESVAVVSAAVPRDNVEVAAA